MFSESPAGPGAEGLVQVTVGLSVARSLSEKVLFQETLSQHTGTLPTPRVSCQARAALIWLLEHSVYSGNQQDCVWGSPGLF